MEQIKYDLEVLDAKIKEEFEQYEDQKVNLDDLELIKQTEPYQNVVIAINNYQSQAYGRQRCFNMFSMTRKDYLEAMKEHFQSQKDCYSDMRNMIKSWGDIIKD